MVPGGSGSQISRQSAHEGGKVVTPTHRPPLPPGNIPGTHFCYRLSQLQGHAEKFQLTPSRIERTTIRLVAQCFDRLCHRVPPIVPITYMKKVPCRIEGLEFLVCTGKVIMQKENGDKRMDSLPIVS